MSRIAELMTSAEQLGIQLWVEANELCFKAPKGALNTELKTALSEHKADIIAFLQKKQEAFEAVDEHRFPLSHGQQALWFVYQETPDSPAYNMASALHISSDADSTALQRALHQVIKRHAQLRMHFEVDSEGGIWQQVTDKLPKLEIIEAGRWGWEELLEKAYRYSQQPFDLMQSGLRAALFQQANDSCLLVFVLHHIFYDARSIGIIQQEWLTLYAAETQGQPVDLPALPMSYAHYVRDEAKWLDSLQGRQSAEYWHQQLAGEVPVLNLPADHPRPRRQTFHGASYRFCLSPALSARLTVLAQNQKTSLFTLLLGAFQVLLHRYTGQTDIWVGTPTSAGRLNDEFSQLAGYFVNPVVLRSRFTGQSLSFQQLITQLHSHVIEALAHQAYPFPLLVQRLHPQRDTGSSPLFQVMFSWHSQSTEPELVSAGLSYVPVDLPQMQSQFDVSLTIAEGTEFGCVLNYKADLFNAERIEHMAQHLTLLLEGIVAQPGQDIHQYPLLTASEIQKLQTWNQTETDCPKDKTIVDLFEEQVEKAPDNIAVVFENLRFTYAELNRRANRLAHALIALGVQADTLVGICVERSLEMVVGLLGILKAGGAYVPLDPDYPRERLHFMLEDSQAPVLLTQSFLQERLPELPAKAVCLDKAGTFQEQPSGNPDRCGRPEDLAYVIYTSGSTGKPKGCLMTHANVSRLFTATENWYHFNENDVWTLFHSYAFDFSVWELWGALCFGGKLVVVPYLTSRSPDAFLDLLIQHQVTVLNQTPSAFSQLIQADRARQSRYALRWVIFGGEALDLSSLKPWFAKHGDQQPRLINMYGITETTVHVTCYPLSHQSTQRHASVIGQAIPDLNIHLLDRHNQPLPIGIPGELCIAGAGLARGYLNRPGLTAEKFIEVELLGKVQRIYKTGDLARWLPDGNLEYLGRIDCQIKLRGFRIEPGEIEAVLSQHDAVKEAVVILHEREGNQSLAAYVTMFNDQCSMTNETAGSTLNIDNCSLNIELRDWLKARLPDYMVPAGFTVLDKLPLTPNGKIDRKALPEPEAVSGTEQVAPRTETEALLAALWSAVLKTEVTSTAAGFFDLGGHSLLATRLASRIRDGFGVDMPLRTLFEHPILGELAAWLDRQQRGDTLPPIMAQPQNTPLLMSYAQQRLWFLAQLEGPSAIYNMPAALKLSGTLNSEALRQTFLALVERHLSLRLRFPERDGKAAVQVIPVYDPLTVADLSPLPETEQQIELRRIIQTHAGQPFDLANGPLLRLHLLTLNDREQVLLFNMHHIISDGWSMDVLIREWTAIYAALSQGRSLKHARLDPLPVQYPDYAVWQRQWLQGEVLQRQLDYWTAQLSGAPELLELPADFPRPPVQSYRGAHLQTALSPELTRQIKTLSQQQGCTLFMTLLAAFSVLLCRYTRLDDILIGSPIANRTCSQTENLIGFFVNTLVLRTQIPDQANFTDLLKQVRQTALGAYAHQDIPFEHLVEQLNPERSLSHSPLFQVMFALQNNEESKLNLPGLTLQSVEQENTIAKFDLTLNVNETDGQLALYWEYAADLFHAERIQRMAEHFAILLKGIVQQPAADIHALPLLTKAETRQLIEWNRTETDYPKDKTIVDLFEEQVEKTPDNIAAVFEGQQLTYAELNRQANQLAHALIVLGVQADTLVGICVERSLEMVVGLLGILKAGGAYVPLDPDYPRERLHFMLEDSQAPVLLTQSFLRERLPKLKAEMVCLDEAEAFQEQPAGNPDRRGRPEDLAYVIYTSGSTGKPKGVMISHLALANFLHDMRSKTRLHAQNRLLALTTLSFDIAGLELYLPLAAGACIDLITRQTATDAEQLKARLVNENINLIQATPATWKMLLDSDWRQTAPLTVLCGGEAMPADLGKALLANSHQLWNVYGPTETTVWSTAHNVTQQPQKPELIGRPIANTQIHILDANHKSLPIDIPGELCIAGAGLARGYLNRPNLTAEKFIEVELLGKLQRIYKTGDLARRLPDGNLEYLGRIDCQVKLRGFRIEPGEIETVLRQHEIIKEAVVSLHEREDNPSLAAYVTMFNDQCSMTNETAGSTLNIEHCSLNIELRDWLKTRLPDYMVPAGFTVLDKLPLTPNGKIDRKALPAPEAVSGTEQVAPHTETEALLAALWSAVLKTEVASTAAGFFDLGGHSLLATRLASRIRDGFGVDMPLRTLFEHPILGDLAAWLDLQQRGDTLPPIMAQPQDTPLVLSHAQQRLWFLAQLEGPSAAYNMPAALKLSGTLNSEALRQTFLTLVERHQSLRLCFPEQDGEAAVQVIPVYDPLTVADLSHLPEIEQQAELRRLIQTHASQPFDLAGGPLLRLRLLTLNDREQVLLFNMHHIISDGWSIGVLIREWAAIYAALSQGRSLKHARLEPLPVQYPDYAAWQRQWLQGEVLQQQLDYWTKQLSGAPELLELPADFPRPPVQSYRGACLQTALSPELTRQIKTLSQQQGCTLFMTLLAAFSVLLCRYTRLDDILIGSPIANRTCSQTENLIGFFVNTLVLRTQIPDQACFTDLLKQVRQTALGAYAHQDIPFEHLVEQINPERSLSHSPLFQVMFALQNNEESELSLPDLTLQPVEQENTIAKFDLSLNISETDGQLALYWEYATDLFHAERIRRMTEHFAILLKGIVLQPAANIHALPLLTEAETQQLIEWNRTETDYPKDKTIVDLFEEQVEKTPDNISVVFEGQQLTYAELNRQANQLAHALIILGVQADTLVGICVERSLEMVVGLLGILKAGGAYVPLDPDYPRERLHFMLEDSQAPLLLTQSFLRERLPELPAKAVCLDGAGAYQKQPGGNPERRGGPEDLAYVIYTSGSTGRPKGILIKHANLLNATWARHWHYCRDDLSVRLLSTPHFAFDAFAGGAYFSLTTGSTLYLPADAHDLNALEYIIRQQSITQFITTPALYQALLEKEDTLSDSLQQVIVGGETASQNLLEKHFEKIPDTALYNEYGPAEAAIWSSVYTYPQDAVATNTIGMPVANTKIHILDANCQPLPIGIPGELCIAGAGLARGYLNRPDLTAEKFIKVELFGKVQRIYKTGDLARWLPAGCLEYLGRIDCQIKLRGFRIELGEIEAVLSQHETVKEAIVSLHEREGNQSLAAYVTMFNDQCSMTNETAGSTLNIEH